MSTVGAAVLVPSAADLDLDVRMRGARIEEMVRERDCSGGGRRGRMKAV